MPGSVSAPYPTLLGLPAPQLLVYPRATVVAEKLEAMVKLDERNSRLKDYFDIWVLMEHGGVDRAQLINAIIATFSRRQTKLPTELPAGLRLEFASTRGAQWQQFLKRNRLTAPKLENVIEAITDKCWPLMLQAARISR